MPAVSILEKRTLAAAQKCVEAYLTAGTTDLTVAQLCKATGLSQRTFYRYFAIKADTIRPIFDGMTARFGLEISEPGTSLQLALHNAFVDIVIGPRPSHTIALFRLIRADTEMWSVFLEIMQGNEESLAAALASQAGRHRTPRSARAGAVAIVAASRLALEAAALHGADAPHVFDAYVTEFGSPVLTD
jgi:AcrR family transcriptional regulator